MILMSRTKICISKGGRAVLINIEHVSILTYIRQLEGVKSELEENIETIRKLPFGINYSKVSTGSAAVNAVAVNYKLVNISFDMIRVIQGTIDYLKGLDSEFTDIDTVLNQKISNEIGVR